MEMIITVALTPLSDNSKIWASVDFFFSPAKTLSDFSGSLDAAQFWSTSWAFEYCIVRLGLLLSSGDC